MLKRFVAALALALIVPLAQPALAADTMGAKSHATAVKSSATAMKSGTMGMMKPSATTKVLYNAKTKTYHMTDCRHAMGKGMTKMTMGNAIKKGGKACKTCIKM